MKPGGATRKFMSPLWPHHVKYIYILFLSASQTYSLHALELGTAFDHVEGAALEVTMIDKKRMKECLGKYKYISDLMLFLSSFW
jgi:hypothetical protein